MTLERQLLFWISLLVLLLAFFYFLSPVLLPFIAGMGLAYALDPICDWLERRGLSRLLATLAIMVGFVLVLVVVLLALVPVLARQLGELVVQLPGTMERLQVLVTPLLETRFARTLGIDSTTIRNSLGGVFSQGAGWLTGVVASIWAGGMALVNILSLLVVTPVVAFYLLYDWDRMLATMDSLLPRRDAPTIRKLADQVSQAIGGFIRGQGLICLFLACWYAIGLVLIGLNFGLVIGFAAGILSFIPFIGTILGFVIAMGVALAQFWPDWVWIAATAGVFATGQFLEGNILQPRLVGERVGLHPVWLMFSLLAFGYLLGFVGLLIAVPLAATIGVLIRFGVSRYRESPLYADPGEAAIEPPPRQPRIRKK